MSETFLKILNMSITATCVLFAILILRLPLKRAPKRISYALWGVLLFRLVCPVSFSSFFSLFSLLGAPVAEKRRVGIHCKGQYACRSAADKLRRRFRWRGGKSRGGSDRRSDER
jgi:hypothetical protein